MTKPGGGPTIDQSGASEPTEAERDEKGEMPSSGERGRGKASPAGAPTAIDLDTARDRAS
jgi:hypothetical protein